jgi:hypothetical protein
VIFRFRSVSLSLVADNSNRDECGDDDADGDDDLMDMVDALFMTMEMTVPVLMLMLVPVFGVVFGMIDCLILGLF